MPPTFRLTPAELESLDKCALPSLRWRVGLKLKRTVYEMPATQLSPTEADPFLGIFDNSGDAARVVAMYNGLPLLLAENRALKEELALAGAVVDAATAVIQHWTHPGAAPGEVSGWDRVGTFKALQGALAALPTDRPAPATRPGRTI